MRAFYYVAVKTFIYLFYFSSNISLFVLKKAYVTEGRKAEAASSSLVENLLFCSRTHLALGKNQVV